MCNHNDGRAYAQSASGAVRLLPAVPLWYVPYSRTKRIIIALLCMAAPPLGLAFGPRFLKRLQLNIEPPHSSVAYHAETAYQEAFPLQAAGTKDAYILLLSRPGGLPVINASSPQCRIDVFGVEVFAASHCPLAAPVGDFETALETWLTAKIRALHILATRRAHGSQSRAPPRWLSARCGARSSPPDRGLVSSACASA